MRKQNSSFQTDFISEAGIDLTNNDYFACVEYDKYACYVIADGLNDEPDPMSASLASQAVFLKFQEHPSMSKRTLNACLRAADKALCEADSRELLKASITVVITDYAAMRYGYLGNTRLRHYRKGFAVNQSYDMSLANEDVKQQRLPEDTLAEHEERNNLYSYAGQGRGLSPTISKKIKLANGDVIVLYTRGIWEALETKELDSIFVEAVDNPPETLKEVEKRLLEKQPQKLENYTCAAIFVNKVFLDPNRQRIIKKVIKITIVVVLIIAVLAAVIWFLRHQRQKQLDELTRRYTNTIEYIQDNNFLRANEECLAALAAAEKISDKKRVAQISDYRKLIEAVNTADEAYNSQDYENARTAYLTAMERSRYADRIADEYIDSRLTKITAYLSVFDYIQLGDMLTERGDYAKAEEKYLEAKNLATRVFFEEGRQDALNSLDSLYASRTEAEQSENASAQSQAIDEVSAASLVAEGDSAFAKGDYNSANVYYAMAIEKYEKLEDTAHVELVQSKIASSSQKLDDNVLKEQEAEVYIQIGNDHEAAGEMLDAKKQYLFAKNIYRELQLDDKVAEVDGMLEILEISMEESKAKAEAERIAAEQAAVEAAAAESEAAAAAETAAEDGASPKNAIGPGQ